MRIVYRAIRYAGIYQCDWHGGQFIFPPCSPEDMEVGIPAVACIDFAFALQHVCLCHNLVATDLQRLEQVLEIAGAATLGDGLFEDHFPLHDEYEW